MLSRTNIHFPPDEEMHPNDCSGWANSVDSPNGARPRRGELGLFCWVPLRVSICKLHNLFKSCGASLDEPGRERSVVMSRGCTFLVAIFGLGLVGCQNQCGERRYLFPCLRERLSRDDDSPAVNRSATGKDVCTDGTPVSRNGAGFGGETLSYPGSGGMIYNGPTYPADQPFPSATPRPDELPAPGYITPPGLPSNPYSQPRSIDSRLQPKSGGTMTGDKGLSNR